MQQKGKTLFWIRFAQRSEKVPYIEFLRNSDSRWPKKCTLAKSALSNFCPVYCFFFFSFISVTREVFAIGVTSVDERAKFIRKRRGKLLLFPLLLIIQETLFSTPFSRDMEMVVFFPLYDVPTPPPLLLLLWAVSALMIFLRFCKCWTFFSFFQTKFIFALFPDTLNSWIFVCTNKVSIVPNP